MLGKGQKKVLAAFYRNANGKEPVRDWLLTLDREDKRSIGVAISRLEYGWPLGLPLCRPMGDSLWEVRADISGNRIVRVLFVLSEGRMVLLHAFIKKTQKTPLAELELARKRLDEVRHHEQ